jgi:uncharacterized alkaline shock family protein YloU
MDVNMMLETLKTQVNPLTVILFILFISSEVIGAIPGIAASNVFGVIKSILYSIIEKLWPGST